MEFRRWGSIFTLIVVFLAGSASGAASMDSLGIAPQDADYYRQNTIKCKDGSSKFSKEQLNDDFCDCPDGTDEPGTSACPEGRFYCKNKGHSPLIIFSSRVNDGICDCCDGTDEYNGKVKCSNTCWEAGKVARERLTKKIATYREGISLRKIEVEKAKKAFEQDEAELSKLKTEAKLLKGLVERLKEHKEQIEKAEEQERLKREKEAEALKDIEKKTSEEDESNVSNENGNEPVPDALEGNRELKTEDESSPVVLNETPADHPEEQPLEEEKDINMSTEDSDEIKSPEDDEIIEVSNDAEKQKEEVPENLKELSKEELGRLVASRWTGEKTTHETKEDEAGKLENQKDDSEASENYDENNHGYKSDSEIIGRKYADDEDDDDEREHDHSDDDYESDLDPSHAYSAEQEDDVEVSDSSETSNLSWLDKIHQTVQSILQRISLFKSPVDLSDAARVRKEYDETSSKLTKIQSRISKLTTKLKLDVGGDKEFYFFYDKCFETKQDKYVYKVCPFKDASQVEGYSTTRLGSWDKFEDSSQMLFSNGDKCWNGPDRTLKVRLRCGLGNEIVHVDEPSRCEYSAVLSTPVLCLEDKLKDLEKKLKLMNSGELSAHDEL